jgi:hypothetical protein
MKVAKVLYLGYKICRKSKLLKENSDKINALFRESLILYSAEGKLN